MKLRLNRGGRTIVTLACSIALVFSVVPAHAEDKESLENKTSALQEQLADINEELLTISDKIAATEMEIVIVNADLLGTKDALAEAERDEAKQYEAMKSRIKYMYETGDATLLEMLFSAENMADFLNKADFIQNISDYDRDMLLELRKTQQTIADQKDTLESQQNAIQKLQSDLEKRQDELTRKAEATSTDLAAYNAQLEKLRAEEAARLAAEAAAKAAAVSNSTVSNGTINVDSTNISGSDLDVFAAILDCEAVHDYNSMMAVATIIMNRVESSLFPNSVTDVVYSPGQFSPVLEGKLDRTLANGPSSLAYAVAQDAINGVRLAAVADCYYFLTASSAIGVSGVNIGGNLFFQSW